MSKRKSIYISGNDLVFGNTPKTKKTTTGFKAKTAYEEVNLECIKDKCAQILSIFVSNLPQEGSREYFQHIEGIFHERSDWF